MKPVAGLPGLVGITPFQELGVGESVQDVFGLVDVDVEQGRGRPGREGDDVGQGEQPERAAFVLGSAVIAQREAGSNLHVPEFQPGQTITLVGQPDGNPGQPPV